MTKLIKKSLIISAIILNSCFAGDIELLSKEQETNLVEKFKLKNDRYYRCTNDYVMKDNRDNILFFEAKGVVANVKHATLLSIDDLYEERKTTYFSAFKFLNDGVFYKNKLYKFEDSFSSSFWNYLNEAYVFEVACVKDKINTNDNLAFSEEKNLKVVNNFKTLDLEHQNLLEQFVLEYAIYTVLSNSDGGFLISNNPDDEIKNIEDINEIKEKINLYRDLNTKSVIQLSNLIKADNDAKIEAKKKKENSIIHVDIADFAKAQALIKFRKEI